MSHPVPTLLLLAALLATPTQPAGQASRPAQPLKPENAILLTIFLRHDQSKPLTAINEELDRNGWYRRFPPPGTEVVSWYVMMGVGQVVTLRVPPEKLREVNLAVENGAWGGYRTDFYATYDYRPIWEEEQQRHR